jgi:uncharacterized protein YdeI (YjbR/CyaY-like superfamily)
VKHAARRTPPTLEVHTRDQWRTWLEKNHNAVSEIWLVFNKRHTGHPSLAYDDAVEEALCFGWIDSLIKRLSDTQYARKFTPRNADSRWSTLNRQRYAHLQSRGLLAAPGLQRPPTERSAYPPPRRRIALPLPLKKTLQANSRAWQNFNQLTPSCQRAYIGWITAAKRDDTQQRRLHQALKLLSRGQKLGLK